MEINEEALFEYWRDIPGGMRVHPYDKKTFDREGDNAHRFRLDCLPSPFFGGLRTSRVVLLFQNPGYSITDSERANLIVEQDYYASQRNGYGKLPDGNQPGTDWCRKQVKQFGLTLKQAEKEVAFLNICPYHSIEFKDNHMLAALKSSRVAIDYAQNVLFPAAEQGKRTVICLRSARVWGLEQGRSYGFCLFAPLTGRGGNMHHNEMRVRLAELVQNIFS